MSEQILKTRRKFKHTLFSLEISIPAPTIIVNTLQLPLKSQVFLDATVTLLQWVTDYGP
jgi:hypothetical protein